MYYYSVFVCVYSHATIDTVCDVQFSYLLCIPQPVNNVHAHAYIYYIPLRVDLNKKSQDSTVMTTRQTMHEDKKVFFVLSHNIVALAWEVQDRPTFFMNLTHPEEVYIYIPRGGWTLCNRRVIIT